MAPVTCFGYQRSFVLIVATLIVPMTGVAAYPQHPHRASQPASSGPAWAELQQSMQSMHEAFFTPDGRELWVTVRGEDYVPVIDPTQMKEVRRITMATGPGRTMFGPDGRYGFVCSSFTAELTIVDTASHEIVKRVSQASPFCPNIAVSPENDEVWITLKDVGKTQVFSAKPPFEQKALLETGPNHQSRELC